MNDALPKRSAFSWYLASSSLWLAGMSLQGFLIPWLLVGTLQTPPTTYSLVRALIDIPPIAMLFLGGLWADRADGRRLLLFMGVAVTLPPLAVAALGEAVSFMPILLFGMVMATLQSISDPARQAIMNRVTRTDIQRTVTLTTIVTTVVGMGAFWIGGKLEALGLVQVLAIQAFCFALGTVAVYRLPALPARGGVAPNLREGFQALWSIPLVRNIIGLNVLSSLFNAGAYVVAMPYIATRVYEGDAQFFAYVMMAFTAGSIGSNVVLYFLMPLLRPGRVYLCLQLTRVAILLMIWLQPPVWLFFIAVCAWGVNMGVTSTLARTTVQELAPDGHRAQILAFFMFSFMVSSPLSAMLLGALVAVTDPLTALLPGIPVSIAIFIVGLYASGLWSFRSPSARPFSADS